MPYLKYKTRDLLSMEDAALEVGMPYMRFYRYVKAGVLPDPQQMAGKKYYYSKADMADIRKTCFRLRAAGMPMIRDVVGKL